MRMFCNIVFLVLLRLAPADIRFVGSHGAPIQIRWNRRTSVSQAVRLQRGEFGALEFEYRRRNQAVFRYAEDVSLQTGQFRVEWLLPSKTEHCVTGKPWKRRGKSRPGPDHNVCVYK